MRSYTIGETAVRSGFSASALRYYEGIGLVPASGRTDAGYRMYDDEALTRLAFIARAKQLGCTLDEITDLVAIWEGERCEPVQRRLHGLVTDKIARTQAQLVELRAFATQLQTAAQQLQEAPIDGPCDAGCACIAPARDKVPVALGGKPSANEVVCTLDPGDVPARLAAWQRVLAGSPPAAAAGADGARRVELPTDVDLAELARLVADEQRCCAFFSFALTVDDRGIGLEVRAPDGAAALIDELLGPIPRSGVA